MGVCLRVLRESNKSRFDSYSVRNIVLIISHITFRDCRVDIFSDNLSRNSYLFLLAFLDLTVHNVRQHSYRFQLADQQKHRINLFSHSFLLREHMNPRLTCSQRQWLRSSLGRGIARSRVQTPFKCSIAFTATIISSFSFHFRSSYTIYFIYH